MSRIGLRLVLTVPPRAGLDEVLVGLVSLVNDGSDPVTVNGRFTLAEGDLDVMIDGAAGSRRAAWPWPVDSGARSVRLGPGQMLETGVLLLCTDGSMPLFPEPGRYELVARYVVGRFPAREDQLVVTSAPVTVLRTEPTTDAARAHRRALRARDVIQSIAAAGTMGEAGPPLADLAAHGSGPTALLASLARATDLDTGTIREAAAGAQGLDTVTAASAVTSVLLPGDERRDSVAASLDLGRDPRAERMFRAEPLG